MDRHPWIVLAAHWPDINGEGPQGDHTFRAPKKARRDDPNVYGVLPGDRLRTSVEVARRDDSDVYGTLYGDRLRISVARLCHLSRRESGDLRPFLK